MHKNQKQNVVIISVILKTYFFKKYIKHNEYVFDIFF